MARITLTITGMTCDHCRSTVEGALQAAAGVWGAFVDLDGGTAEVEFDTKKTTPDRLMAAVEVTGYGAQTGS